MPRPAKLVKLTVLVPAETKRALERLARARAQSVGTVVRYMLLLTIEGQKQREAPREKATEEGRAGRPE